MEELRDAYRLLELFLAGAFFLLEELFLTDVRVLLLALAMVWWRDDP